MLPDEAAIEDVLRTRLTSLPRFPPAVAAFAIMIAVVAMRTTESSRILDGFGECTLDELPGASRILVVATGDGDFVLRVMVGKANVISSWTML